MARIARVVVPGVRFSIGPFAAVKLGANDYEVAIGEDDNTADVEAAIASIRRRQAKELEAALHDAQGLLARLPAPPQGHHGGRGRDYKTGPHVTPKGQPFEPGAQVPGGQRRCKTCDRAMTADGWDYSMRRHGEPYCIDHDPSRRGGR